jgi:hypothetical protein
MSTNPPAQSVPPAPADPLEQVLERLRNAGGSIPQLFKQALRELDTGHAEGVNLASALLDDMLTLQVQDESARDYGQMPMRAGNSAGDLNNCVFVLPDMIDILARHASRLPAALAQRLDRAARLALVAAQRRWDEEIFDPHRDHKDYTNIFLLYIQALLRGGLHYADARLLRMAAAQWRRWFNHISYSGIDEFVSPTYSDIDVEALRGIHAHAPDEPMRTEARLVLDHLVTLLFAVTHPRLQLPVCGASRDYRRFLPAGPHEPACVARPPASGGYVPPAAAINGYRRRHFPYQVSGRATGVPFRFQSWQTERAAMGSMSGGNYFWQQIHCMVAVGDDAVHREMVFLPGSYTIAGGYVCQQQGRALCVFARCPNTFLRTQRPVPDSQLVQAFGDLGAGATGGWKTGQQDRGRLTLTAYGQTVTIDSFVLEGDQAHPVALTPVQRANLSQGRFHHTPVDMAEWIFPGQGQWLGCVVQLTAGAAQAEPLPVTCRSSDHVRHIQAGADLRLQLALSPTGEVTELYDRDWRTLPLLECPEQTLWPGDLTARAVRTQP